MNADQLEELVKQDKVQYMKWEDNHIKIEYTPEEMKSLPKQLAKNAMENITTDYWNMDAAYKYKHIRPALADMALACSVALPTKILGLTMLGLIAFGDMQVVGTQIMETLYRTTGNRVFSKPQLMTPAFVGNKMYSIAVIYVPLMYINALRDLDNILFDTSTLTFYIKKNINVTKGQILIKQSDNSDMQRIVSILQSITERNEKLMSIQ